MSAVNFNNQEISLMSNSFIVPKYISAPYTTIQNRAQVLDSSNMLQAVMGVERIPFRGINLLSKEFGSAGEQVWELDSKDSRIRFVGTWSTLNNSQGNHIQNTNSGDYLEVVFYGTGLNLLLFANNNSSGNTISIDNGVAFSLGITGAFQITPLTGRNYNQNIIYPAVSGLTLGFHTVKIFGVTSIDIYGVEILNQSTSLIIPAGQAFIGNKKESLVSATTSTYNAGFSGTKGGRVLKYLLNGTVSQVVRECAATPSYLTNANHADEEVVRRINFREFGANRADDFSTLTTARAAAFTLDDGTTTLVGDSVAGDNVAVGFLSHNVNSNFFTITFVGTGLDIIRKDSANGGADTYTIFIDGVSQGTLSSAGSTSIRTEKICSGLSYGTHIVKIVRTSAVTFSVGVSDFIIYQPKAPTLPVGAIQVADYNVMANYVATATNGIISSGVLRKMTTRENTYVGTWLFNADPGMESGLEPYTATAGGYVEFSFFGTGVDHILHIDTSARNWTYSIDGTNPTAAGATTSLVHSPGIGSMTLVGSTGVLSGTGAVAGYSARASFTGLSLGWHKIRLTYNSGTNMYMCAFDTITPIHINHPTLKIGSLSLLDNNNIQAILTPPTLGIDQVRKYDLGYNQNWYLMTSLRTFNTVYYNTTDKPITVYAIGVCGTNNVGGAYVTVGGVALGPTSSFAGAQWQVTFIVPAGQSYQMQQNSSTPTISIWAELR
jgi:hypothetical protein